MIVNYANERRNKQVSKSLTVCQAHVFRTKCKKYRTKNIESKVSQRRDDQAGLPADLSWDWISSMAGRGLHMLKAGRKGQGWPAQNSGLRW